jgi:hypothetical protein
MASLDDIYDMIDKLDASKTEYLLITIQKGKKQGKADVFFSLNDDNSVKILTKGLKTFREELEKRGSDADES